MNLCVTQIANSLERRRIFPRKATKKQYHKKTTSQLTKTTRIMAEIKQGILGATRGKIGPVVGYIWRGKN
ncbi:MAG: hypothetical protein ACRCVU_17230, partial [Flavobacterium sp.]